MKGALTLGGLHLSAPWCRPLADAAPGARHPERSLVLLQLSGGNDGLSTVVPFADDEYARRRPTLRFGPDAALRIEEARALHPRLKGLRQMYHKGYLAIVEGVGSPGPNLSHFQALERWHTADPAGRLTSDGWLGRLCAVMDPDGTRPFDPLHLGPNVPYSVYSRTRLPTCLDEPRQFGWIEGARGLDAYLAEVGEDGAEPLARFRRLLRGARDASRALHAAVDGYRTPVEYPPTPLGARLRNVAALIEARAGAHVFSLEHGNFDTHTEELYMHGELMGHLDAVMSAFLRDLLRSEAGRETLVVLFSEFGRRVEENASGGTDHGTSGPVLLFGAKLRPGLHGRHPSLGELVDENLAVEVDYRSVYATVVEDWLGVDHTAVLGGEHERLTLFAS